MLPSFLGVSHTHEVFLTLSILLYAYAYQLDCKIQSLKSTTKLLLQGDLFYKIWMKWKLGKTQIFDMYLWDVFVCEMIIYIIVDGWIEKCIANFMSSNSTNLGLKSDEKLLKYRTHQF